MKKVPPHQIALSVGAIAVWLALYAGGLLCETIEQRIALAPNAYGQQLGLTDPVYLKGVARGTAEYPVLSFFAAFLAFTPTNLVLLTLAAAFMGGTVSNVIASSLEDHERVALPPRRLAFLSEHPLAATMRGFVIYLCVIAGLYIAMDDPFKETSPGQYARLAGSLSLAAFAVGYDPSRIEGFLRLLPTPAPRTGMTETEVRHEVTTQVTQQETFSAAASALPPSPAHLTPPSLPAAEPVAAGSSASADLAEENGNEHRPSQPR
jgi:hypothetical protein